MQSEEKLIFQAVRGDRCAFSQLCKKHRERLQDHVKYKMSNQLKARLTVDDIIQVALEEAWHGIERFGGTKPNEFFSWVKRIAVNRIRDEARKYKAAKYGGNVQCTCLSAQDLELLDAVSECVDTPSRSARLLELKSIIQKAMEVLPEEECAALTLQIWENQSVDEIAKTMKRTAGSVRGLLQRGKRRLAAILPRLSSITP